MLDASSLLALSSVFFLFSGLSLIHFLVKVFIDGFKDSFGGLFERWAFRRQRLGCRRGDELLAQDDLAGAVQAFGSAFFLKPIRQDVSLLTEVGKYHTGLLNRLLTVADELDTGGLSLPALADTDRLLTERLEMQLDAFRARTGEGRPSGPIDPQLKENERHLRTAIDRLLRTITSSGQGRVVYH